MSIQTIGQFEFPYAAVIHPSKSSVTEEFQNNPEVISLNADMICPKFYPKTSFCPQEIGLPLQKKKRKKKKKRPLDIV